MSAPVFDPLTVGVDPVDASMDVLLALQAAHRLGHAAGVEAGMQQGFIQGHDLGISEGLIKAKDLLDKAVHGG